MNALLNQPAVPPGDPADPATLERTLEALPPTVGDLLALALSRRQEAARAEKERAARAAVEHWEALAACVRVDLGSRDDCGAELLAAAELSMPSDWTEGTRSYCLRVRLPGLAPLVRIYRWRTQWEKDAPGGDAWTMPDLTPATFDPLEEALLFAYEGYPEYCSLLEHEAGEGSDRTQDDDIPF